MSWNVETVVHRQNAHHERAGIKGPHPCESLLSPALLSHCAVHHGDWSRGFVVIYHCGKNSHVRKVILSNH